MYVLLFLQLLNVVKEIPKLSERTVSTIGGKMKSLTKCRGRRKASVRRKGHRAIYATFDKISDARSLSY